jgi:hypothetical protein
MSAQIRVAQTAQEKEEVYRFRYRVYVEEMGRVQEYADHLNKRIEEPLDQTGRILMACDDTGVVGTLRHNVGSHAGFGKYDDLYNVQAFGDFRPLRLSITTKLMVAPSFRRSTLPLRLAVQCFKGATSTASLFGIIDCNPPLVGFFERLGYRRVFANIDHPEYGNVVPMILVMYDLEHLRACDSPFVNLAAGHDDEGSIEFFKRVLLSSARSESLSSNIGAA